MATETPQRNIVIVGGGVIGATCAYFLTRHPSYNPSTHRITILEAQSIASAASGKAGGLLGLWAYPSSIVPLSYKLHAELAAEHGGDKRWGYRAVHCGSVSARGKDYTVGNGTTEGEKGEEWKKLPKTTRKSKTLVAPEVPKDLDWLDNDAIRTYSEMGTPATTAQVHPYLFTTSMASLAADAGVSIILGSVTTIDHSGPEGVKSVTYSDKSTKETHTLPATDVILAAGPWTAHVFPRTPIDAIRAHSVVIKAEVSPYAVFTEIELPNGYGRKGEGKRKKHASNVNPEMYARPDGTVYACGEGDDRVPLPPSSDLVVCDEEKCQDVIDYLGSISTAIREGEVVTKQACYLPSVTTGGGPLIGETGIRGLLMATGHTCWGIQNSCATGKLISEFVFEGGAKSADVGELDPRKFL